MSGFKKDVVLVGSRMNLTDGQVQEKIRQDILEGRDAAGEDEAPGIFLSPAITFTKTRTFPMKRSFPLAPQNLRG